MQHRLRWMVVGCALLVAGCSGRGAQSDGGGPDGAADAGMGSLGGPCYPNNTCNSGLTCQNGLCVQATVDGSVPTDAVTTDLPRGSCQPGKDSDGDSISDLDEGCLLKADSDGDGTPDFLDTDSDNDGLSDAVEAGDSSLDTAPVDSDGDGYPDAVDKDSDGDGLADGLEDINADGRLGCCRTTCNESLPDCPATQDGCGPGQTCDSGGKCTPAVKVSCAMGESDPKDKDTFGVGWDKYLGNSICSPTSADNPVGSKSAQLTSDAAGDWTVALDGAMTYTTASVASAGAVEALATVDDASADATVAGFVLSRPLESGTLAEQLTKLVDAMVAAPPGGASTTVQQLSAGTGATTHDGFPALQNVRIGISAATAIKVSAMRDGLVAALLGRTLAQLTNLPGPVGSGVLDAVLQMVVVQRGDRLLLMGGVGSVKDISDSSRRTAMVLQDLVSGLLVTKAGASVTSSCEGQEVSALPMAEIIWVIDESGNMRTSPEIETRVLSYAGQLFDQALAAGIDFRMGVTGVCSPSTGACSGAIGKLCSAVSTSDPTGLGGVDRFLLPSEKSAFLDCVANPPGEEMGDERGLLNAKEAVVKHLPRAAAAPDKIRPGAKVAIIIVTNEVPNGMQIPSFELDVCPLSAATQSMVDKAVQPYIDTFKGTTDPEAQATVHHIGGVCGSPCSFGGMNTNMPHAYKEVVQAVGGTMMDLCQANLSVELQGIVDGIVGTGSPLTLMHSPIPHTLSVALDGVVLDRSRSQGFDYSPRAGSITLHGVPFSEGSIVIASYESFN